MTWKTRYEEEEREKKEEKKIEIKITKYKKRGWLNGNKSRGNSQENYLETLPYF